MSPAQVGLLDHPDDTRRKVDEEIAELEARLISLKSYRNTLAPIARLHPEILQVIFFFAHDTSEPSHKGKIALAITWICHDWRELACQTSNLWNQIDFTHQEWIDAAISRTKAQKLEFTFNCASRRKTELTHLSPLCLGNLSRIRSLVITAGDGPISSEHGVPVFDNQVWANPAPSLEQLHLEYVCINGHGRFSGVCPSLHSLYLKYCIFGWHTLPIVPSITELSIIQPIVRVRIDDIMKILQVVGPSLEKLQLWDVINETQSIPAHSSDRYEFPELDSFWLRETDAGLIAPFLSRISLPHSLEALHISARRSDWVTSGLVQALVSSRNLEKWPLDYLLVAYEDPVVVLRVIEDWSEDSSDDEDSDDEDSNERDGNKEDGGEGGGNMVNDEDDGDDGDGGDEGNDENDSDDDLETNHRHVELEIRMANDASSIIPVLEQLQVPIEPIKSVYFLSTFGSVQDQTILEYFGNLGTIQVLTITETFFPTLVEFLMVQVAKLQAIDILKAEGHDNPLGAGLDIDHISFLNLDTLQIRDSNNQGYETLTPNNFLVLQEWLTWRKRYGLPLLDLSISGVVVRLPSIGTLTELFGDLVSNLELEDVKPEGDIV